MTCDAQSDGDGESASRRGPSLAALEYSAN